MINGIYKETLGKNGMFTNKTRVKYVCPECGKQQATQFGNYKRHKNNGMCLNCLWNAKK